MFLPQDTPLGGTTAMDQRDREDRDDALAPSSEPVRTVSSDVSPETSEPDPIATSAAIHTKVDLGIRGTEGEREEEPQNPRPTRSPM
jgi:hypothetical protein